VVVTAEDGTSQKTYTIAVTRTAPSADATLSSLSVSGYSILPAFNANTTNYTLTVPYNVTSIIIAATAASSTAQSVSGTGTKTLSVGANTCNVVVTAQDGTSKTYIITVTRTALSTDATLSTLSIPNHSISPTFNATTTSYTLSVPYSETTISIVATAADSKANVSGTGAKSLNVGANTCNVVVTAEDGTTKKTYTITVTRAAQPALVRITAPAPITNLPSGTAKTAAALGLPATAEMVTTTGNVQAEVTWNLAGADYAPRDTVRQVFMVGGVATLPPGVTNPSNVSLSVSVVVMVNAAMCNQAQSYVLFLNGEEIHDEQVVRAGTSAIRPQAPIRPNDTFVGWYNGENLWDFNSLVTCDLRLTAKWQSEIAPTAIATQATVALQIYPNPLLNEQLIVNNEQLKTGDKIEVYSLSGALLKTFVAAGARSSIDISSLPAGVYVVKAGNGAGKVVKR
jgi:uncharacterized repeat protein (TIGR02543 family)